MRQLRLVGLAEDGGSLVLETPTGESFRLPVDERLRAACRGDLTRLGQIEIEMDNPLRPRDIQARVRAGESAEEVAASAGMALDRVLRFAYPVLQERARVVAQARTTRLRTKDPQPLGELVEERLVGRGTDAATLRWDAWRREDGRWTVRLTWRHATAHSATWIFHLAARSLQPDDPAAAQLGAEEFHARTITAVTPLAVAARVSGRPGGSADRSTQPGAGRAAPHGGHPAGSARPPASRDPGTVARSPRPEAARESRSGRGGTAGKAEARAGRSGTGGAGAADAEPGEATSDSGRTGEEPVDPPRRVAAGGGQDVDADDERSRRASVPSWDDILLGVRRRH